MSSKMLFYRGYTILKDGSAYKIYNDGLYIITKFEEYEALDYIDGILRINWFSQDETIEYELKSCRFVFCKDCEYVDKYHINDINKWQCTHENTKYSNYLNSDKFCKDINQNGLCVCYKEKEDKE